MTFKDKYTTAILKEENKQVIPIDVYAQLEVLSELNESIKILAFKTGRSK